MESKNFDFIRDENSREMVEDGYAAVTKAEAWDLMKEEPGLGGFMYTTNESYRVIHKHMDYRGHSGASYGWTMRQLQFIAISGWDAYVALWSEQPRSLGAAEPHP
jgi:hypothetical protein